MEVLNQMPHSEGVIACCECGASISPNPTNMCIGCLRSRVDITEGIPKQSQLYSCRNCSKYFAPPSSWTFAELESKELLTICLKRLKPTMTKVRLVDASFIWTEPHSKRVKVKLTIQKEMFSGAILQQSFVVEFVMYNQMCDICRRAEAKDYWRACVQVRQKCDFKKTLFYLEQLILKHNAQSNSNNVKPVPTGIDFYYAKKQDAKKFIEFVMSVLPCKYHHSQQLVTHDIKNNFYDYKHTFCIDVVPITKDCLICLPRRVAQQCGNMGQFVLCLRVTSFITLIDPNTLQTSEVTALSYWKDPFDILMQPKGLVEFYVIEIDYSVDTTNLPSGHGHISTKHTLGCVVVVRSHNVGQADAQMFCCRTHLAHLLTPGDSVLGYDIANSNLNNATFDAVKSDQLPDVVLVKKIYDRSHRMRKRQWKLKRLYDYDEGASTIDEFNNFVDDIEEDRALRENINIYRKVNSKQSESASVADDEDEVPDAPTLAEMLNELDINTEDVEMKEEIKEEL